MNELKLYHTYTDKFDHTKRIWGYQIKDLNEKYEHGNWRNLEVHNSWYGGQIGHSNQIINETLPVNSDKQFIRFICPTSVGLNSLGQTFLIQSIEAFCYSIPGAQADSRFLIVNQGAKSMQTQAIFHQLVNSSIVQNDNTIMLNNFRTSVKDTNVLLNQNVSPGLLIIPSLNKVSEKKKSGTIGSPPNKQNYFVPQANGSKNHYSNQGPPLGATGKKGDKDKEKNNENTLIYTILTFIAGIVVFEIAISNKGFSFHAKSKSKK